MVMNDHRGEKKEDEEVTKQANKRSTKNETLFVITSHCFDKWVQIAESPEPALLIYGFAAYI